VAAWIIALVGCAYVVRGAGVLKGWGAARYSELYADPRVGGWAAVSTGAGFVLGGLPHVLGWPRSAGVVFALVGLVLIVGRVACRAEGPEGPAARPRDRLRAAPRPAGSLDGNGESPATAPLGEWPAIRPGTAEPGDQ